MKPAPPREPEPPGRYLQSLRSDLVAGLARVYRDPRQRAVIGVAATSNAATIISTALLPLWLSRDLGLPVWTLGVVLATGGGGAVIAGLLLGKLGHTDAPWRRIAVALVIAGAGLLLLPLASGPLPVRLIMLCGSEIILQAGVVVVAANAMSWRQASTPQHLLAKVISVARTVNYGILPLASLAGGALATAVGVRPVLFVTAGVLAVAPLWLLGSTVDPSTLDSKLDAERTDSRGSGQ